MPVDMSPEAVTARLKQVSELRRLCLSLGRAKPVDAAPAGEAKNPSLPSPDGAKSPGQKSPSDSEG